MPPAQLADTLQLMGDKEVRLRHEPPEELPTAVPAPAGDVAPPGPPEFPHSREVGGGRKKYAKKGGGHGGGAVAPASSTPVASAAARRECCAGDGHRLTRPPRTHEWESARVRRRRHSSRCEATFLSVVPPRVV